MRNRFAVAVLANTAALFGLGGVRHELVAPELYAPVGAEINNYGFMRIYDPSWLLMECGYTIPQHAIAGLGIAAAMGCPPHTTTHRQARPQRREDAPDGSAIGTAAASVGLG